MAGKKTNELTNASDVFVATDTNLLIIADPGTGLAYKMTVQQAKAAYGTFVKTYRATGTEGGILTIAELSGKEILSIDREAGPLWPVATTGTTPSSSEYDFDGTNIKLGTNANPSERFKILYKTPA